MRATVRGVRPTGPATIARVRATLRKAFNDALTKEVITGVPNPAALVKTPNPRAKPVVWEPERVARWEATGEVPSPVMVWPAELLSVFLDYAAEHAPDLHPMLHLMAYRGPRRGEACGLLDAEVRLGRHEVSIVNQIAAHGQTAVHKAPKSAAGNREVILDPDTVAVLTAYKARRATWQLKAGPVWPETGLFFVRPDGRAWHPSSVSQRFRRLVKRAGLPPIRLHDLRHVSATVALDAGVDIKIVSEQLGHSTTTLTRDTYQSVTKRLHHEAAGAVADAIKNNRRHRRQPSDESVMIQTNDERRTTNDERRTTNDERRTTNDERRPQDRLIDAYAAAIEGAPVHSFGQLECQCRLFPSDFSRAAGHITGPRSVR